MSGCIIHGSLAGKNPYLSKHEEEELVTYLATCSKVGYPKKRDEIIGIVQEILSTLSWPTSFQWRSLKIDNLLVQSK